MRLTVADIVGRPGRTGISHGRGTGRAMPLRLVGARSRVRRGAMSRTGRACIRRRTLTLGLVGARSRSHRGTRTAISRVRPSRRTVRRAVTAIRPRRSGRHQYPDRQRHYRTSPHAAPPPIWYHICTILSLQRQGFVALEPSGGGQEDFRRSPGRVKYSSPM